MDSAEASGKTVDDALNRALNQIGATRDDVDKERVRFDVLDEGRKGGLFGRGAKDATVRVERVAASPAPPRGGEARGTRPPRPEGSRPEGGRGRGGRPDGGRQQGGGREPAGRGAPRGARGPRQTQTRTGFEQPVPKLTDADFVRAPRFDEAGETAEAEPALRKPGGQRSARPADSGRPPREERPDRGERRPREDQPYVAPNIDAEEVDFAAETVDDLLRMLDIPAELNIREPLTPGDGLGNALAVIDIKGEDLGLLIGRRGDTLLSLQYLVNLIIARKFPGKGGVTIDVEHYRHRNEERIISLAKRMAERVRESGSPITLEPMSASERRLVHMTFADDPDLETNSVGEGENRKVVISRRR